MNLTRHLSYANVAATLALVVALGGGGAVVAAGGLGKNTVGSKQIKPAAVKLVDLAPGAVDTTKIVDDSVTGTDVLESSLGKVPAAAAADTALTAGRATNVLRATVDDAGTLIAAQSDAGVTATRLSAGEYEVVFGRTVTACTPYASLAEAGAGNGTQTGSVSVTGRSAKPAALFVNAADANAADADRDFTVLLVC